MKQPAFLTERGTGSSNFLLVLAVLAILAYAPALRLGFISDDYVMLGRLADLRQDPLYLFSIPPEGFRSTNYAAFALMRAVAGGHAPLLHAFAILLHLANALMLWRLLVQAGCGGAVARTSALVFAVFQVPQEAVMWLAGMNESLMAAGLLGCLLFWIRGRHGWATALFPLALLSKESALVLVLLAPLLDRCRLRRFVAPGAYFLLSIPALALVALFAATRNANPLLGTGLYAIGPHALLVLPASLHSLLFPWGYLLAAAAWLRTGRDALRPSLWPLAWMGIALLPYLFLTYQSHVPSRNLYLASMGLAWLLASLAGPVFGGRGNAVGIAVFAAANILYLWVVKVPQYERRAAPTDQLLLELTRLVPQPVRVSGFPGISWIAKNTTLLLPGWRPDMLKMDEPESGCPSCPELAWQAREGKYLRVR